MQPDSHPDHQLKTGQFIGLLALLILVSFPQIIIGYQTFIVRDFGNFSYPIAHYLRECFWRGEIPLWNPLNNCGSPFLAQWNTQVLYPPALFYLIFPLSWSLGVFCLLHLFLGGAGMFLLARHWTKDPFAAAFAGVVFSLSGLMLSSLVWPATIAALGWMPWVVLLSQRAWLEGGKILVFAAFAGALQMLSGGAEMVVLTWLLLGALGLLDLLPGRMPRGKMIFRSVLLVFLISALSAAQILPFLDLLNHSHRQDAGFFASQWPMPATGWLNFLVPLFHYQSSGDGYFLQIGQFWTASYYVGVTALTLAGWSVLRVRRGQVWILAALTLFCLVMALGDATPIYSWFCRHAKIFSLMRFPIKFVILPVFAFPLLAAYGLAEKRPATRRQWLFIWAIPVILIILIIELAHRFRMPTDDLHATVANALFRVAFLTAILGALFALTRLTDSKQLRWLQVLVLLLVWLDLYLHLPQPPTTRPDTYAAELDRKFESMKPGTSRVYIPDDQVHTLIFASDPDATRSYLFHRFSLFSNCNLLEDIPKCDGFFPLELREPFELSAETPALLDFKGVSETLTSYSNVFWWLPRSTFMPLISGGQKPIFASETNLQTMLAGTNFNPRTEVYLPLETQSLVTATNPVPVKITPETFSGERITASVECVAPAMIVVAQTYYHPWHAYVDGQPTPLLRANIAFQAVEVPAGSHRLELVYEDRKFYLGVIISLATLVGCLVFLIAGRKKVQSA